MNRRLIHLHSANRTSGPSNDFSFNVNNSQLRNVKKIGLLSAEIPNTIYNVFDSGPNQNNELVIDALTGGIQTLTLNKGFYNSTHLVSTLQTEFDLKYNPGDYTVSLSSVDATVTITNNVADTFRFGTASTLHKILGYNEPQASDTRAGSQQGVRPVDLRGFSFIFLHTDLIHSSIDDKGRMNDSIHKVQLDQPFGSTVFFKNNNQHELFDLNREMSSVRVSLRDDDGNLVDINGFDWSLTFVAYI